MDAEERFHQKRMECVEYCIFVKHNIHLDLISLNWTLKHVSVKGQIVVKTCQSGSLKYINCQDIETEVEGQMENDVPLCLRKTEEKSKDGSSSSSNEKTTKKK